MTDQYTRREANRLVLAGAFALLGTVAVKPARAAKPLFDFAIAGGGYHGLDAARGTLVLGERLVLRPEPENEYDVNAVAVHRADNLMLGYVPRAANPPIARLLQDGARVEAVVVGRLSFRHEDEIPDDFAATEFRNGDPRIRLMLVG